MSAVRHGPALDGSFTKRERRRSCDSYGHRPVNGWGDGDLPAPWACGDLVELPEGTEVEDDRWEGRGPAFLVVCCAFSIDEGDAWYFRVTDGEQVSDRLHVSFASRSTFSKDLDYMAPLRLVDTADPEGLAKRESMLRAGWSYTKRPRCGTCGHEIPEAQP